MSPPRVSSASLYALTGTHSGLPMCLKTPFTPFAHLCLFRSLAEQSSLLNTTRGKLQRAAEIPMLCTAPTMRTHHHHTGWVLSCFRAGHPTWDCALTLAP